MPAPLRASFSVATMYGARLPFQSKDELRMASRKSPFGKWSVHWRWPWKPAAIALWPCACSPRPIAASRGLPVIRSRAISAIFTLSSHSVSICSRLRVVPDEL